MPLLSRLFRRPHSDQRIRFSGSRLSEDLEADLVLDCLSGLAGLYGDSLMVVQFLPHCWDLVSRAKWRLSPSLASSLLATTSVTHTSVCLLSDSVLMNELPHSLPAHILAPLLQVITSRRVVFLTAARVRLVLLYKLLDAVYIVGEERRGDEQTPPHSSRHRPPLGLRQAGGCPGGGRRGLGWPDSTETSSHSVSRLLRLRLFPPTAGRGLPGEQTDQSVTDQETGPQSSVLSGEAGPLAGIFPGAAGSDASTARGLQRQLLWLREHDRGQSGRREGSSANLPSTLEGTSGVTGWL